MSSYGTPDFFRPPSPGGQIIAGSKGYTAGTITFFPQDVSAFASMGVRLRPTGVITGYSMVVDFYADSAGTKLVDEYVWQSIQGAVIFDKVTPPAPWMKCTVTPQATGGGQTLDIWLLGFGAGEPSQLSVSNGVLCGGSGTVLAGQADILYCNVARAGPVQVLLDTGGANWYSEISAMNAAGGVEGWVLRADQTTQSKRYSTQLILGRNTYRFYYANNDGVNHTVTRTIVSI